VRKCSRSKTVSLNPATLPRISLYHRYVVARNRSVVNSMCSMCSKSKIVSLISATLREKLQKKRGVRAEDGKQFSHFLLHFATLLLHFITHPTTHPFSFLAERGKIIVALLTLSKCSNFLSLNSQSFPEPATLATLGLKTALESASQVALCGAYPPATLLLHFATLRQNKEKKQW